jgi:hypothetical protein
MRPSDLTIALITDEVSPLLDEGLSFARQEALNTVDLRVVDGRSVLALSRPELEDVARRVRAAGLTVSCLCTPLLKWNAPGQQLLLMQAVRHAVHFDCVLAGKLVHASGLDFRD